MKYFESGLNAAWLYVLCKSELWESDIKAQINFDIPVEHKTACCSAKLFE
jgi:hypothetical protein